MSDTAKRFDDLPDETKEFLLNFRSGKVRTLNDGIRLLQAIRTVGTFMKWLIVGILGLVVGVMMLRRIHRKNHRMAEGVVDTASVRSE